MVVVMMMLLLMAVDLMAGFVFTVHRFIRGNF
jgi:hypothetical protein